MGGYSRIVSCTTMVVQPRRGRSATAGGRSPRTSPTSARSRRQTPGWVQSRYQTQVRAEAMVAWPAMKKLIVSSRTCLSVRPLPVSSSTTETSMLTRSSPPGLRRRSAISGYRNASSSSRLRWNRRVAGRGSRAVSSTEVTAELAKARMSPTTGPTRPMSRRQSTWNSDAARLARLTRTISGSRSRGRPLSAWPAQASSTSPVAATNWRPYPSSEWRRNAGWAILRDRTHPAPSAPTSLPPVAHERRPRVVGRLVLEHVLGPVRVGDQVQGHRPPEPHRVPISPPGVEEREHVVPADLGQAAQQEIAPRPRRPPPVQRRDQLTLRRLGPGSALPGGVTCLPLPSGFGNGPGGPEQVVEPVRLLGLGQVAGSPEHHHLHPEAPDQGVDQGAGELPARSGGRALGPGHQQLGERGGGQGGHVHLGG